MAKGKFPDFMKAKGAAKKGDAKKGGNPFAKKGAKGKMAPPFGKKVY